MFDACLCLFCYLYQTGSDGLFLLFFPGFLFRTPLFFQTWFASAVAAPLAEKTVLAWMLAAFRIRIRFIHQTRNSPDSAISHILPSQLDFGFLCHNLSRHMIALSAASNQWKPVLLVLMPQVEFWKKCCEHHFFCASECYWIKICFASARPWWLVWELFFLLRSDYECRICGPYRGFDRPRLADFVAAPFYFAIVDRQSF